MMSEREARYQDAVNQGHSAAWDQDWEKASAFYRQALVEKPEEPKALNNLALALFELGNFEEALNLYLRVIEKTPNDPVPLEKAAIINEILDKPVVGSRMALRAAELYIKNGDVEKAIENWTRILAMNPEHLGAHSRLALVYERLKRTSQAVQEYLHIASLLQHTNQKEKAVQAVNRALKLSPDHENVHQALSMLREDRLLSKPARPQKIKETVSGVTTEPSFSPVDQVETELPPAEEAEKMALSTLAGLFFEQNSEENIEQQSRTGGLQALLSGSAPIYAKNVDKTQLMLHLGQAVEYLSREENEPAATELERVVDIGLHHPAAFYQLGILRLKGERLESAIRYLKRSVSHTDYAFASRLLIAQAYQNREKIKEASKEYLEALRLADCEVVPSEYVDDLHSRYDPLLEAHAQNVDENKASQVCKTIGEMLDRPRWRQYVKRVRSELVSDDGGPPTPLAEVLTEASSSDVVVSISNIRDLVKEGRRQAALEEALFALQDAPTYLPLHVTIGDLLASENQTEAAIEKYNVVARSHSVRGETSRAIDMLRRIVDMSPMDLDVRNRLIGQLVARGQNRDAVKELAKMAEIHYSLAELTEARKTYSRTLRLIQQSGIGDNWRVQILHRIADIDVQSLNWRQALTIYQQIMSIQPDEIDANTKLVNLNFRLGERNQALAAVDNFVKLLRNEGRQTEVISFLETLSEDWPDQVILKRYLADIYQELGKPDDAIKQLDAAGEFYLNSGNRDEAICLIRKIIGLNPPDIGKYRQLLDELQSS
jgi:tetratricopeptide (TPR) repeat protein